LSDQAGILKKYTLLIIAAWTLLHLFLLLIEFQDKKKEMINLAREEAKAIFEKDVIFRRWNAMHGGVYVPVTEKTPANPYLAHITEREITTPSGKKLTLMNPAYMTRQAHEIAAETSGIIGHITSLNPIRHQNEADPWEKKALKTFESGEKEYSSTEFIRGVEYLRFMAPLKTEEPCLKCHAFQGYKVGDIRGGISVSVPMQIFRSMINRSLFMKFMSHGLIWLAGLVLIRAGSRRLQSDLRKIREAEEATKQFASDLEKLLAVSREMTMITDLKPLYRTIVGTCRDILKFDCSTLLLLTDNGRKLVIEDTVGFPESMIGNFRLVEGEGLASLVVKSRNPETVESFDSETRFAVPAVVKEMKLTSALAVPMIMNDEVFGILIGHVRERRRFSQTEVTIYQHIANQSAVTIRNLANANAILRSESRLRRIIESIGEGLYVLDSSGNILLMNSEAERLLGWTEQELTGRNIHNIIHNRRADGSTLLFDDCPMHQIVITGEQYVSDQEVFVHRNGNVFPVFVISTPLVENGSTESSITIFRDISDRIKLENDREALITELQKALADIRTLHGILPICSFCKKIRDDKGAWKQLEAYICDHTDAQLSHGLCEECAAKMYPKYFRKSDANGESDYGE